MTLENSADKFKNEYSNFLVFLGQQFPTMDLESFQSEPFERVKRFNDLMKSQTLFNFFLKSKIKLFSHKETNTLKISESCLQ